MKTAFWFRHVPLAICAAGLAGPVLAQNEQEQALRELNIMRNIFAAALAEDDDRRSGRPPEALWLAGQGMVFTFDLPGLGGGFHFNPAPVLDALHNLDTGQFDFDYDFDFDFDFDDGAEQGALAEQQAAYQEELRAINDVMRDRQREMRDLQRELRNLERAAGDRDNAAEIDRVSDELQKLTAEVQNMNDSYMQLQKEFETERNAAVSARRDEQTLLIFDTLCTYGNTLRTLANQHVSLVLRNYSDDQSQIYVLEHADVASCSSAASLRQAAQSYQMPE